MTGKIKVFVYGTLKQSQCRNGILKDSKFLGADKIKGSYRFVDLGAFPAVIHDPAVAEREIVGETYLVNLDMLNSLDCIEGHPDFYRRVKIETAEQGKAWCYMLPDRYTGRYDEVKGDSWPEAKEA